MLYLTKGIQNELYMNVNNNSRNTFTGYTLEFTHVMSKEVKTYSIDTSNPNEYFSNIRYCIFTLPLDSDDLNYEGQYVLKIYGDGTENVFNGMVVLEGTQEEPAFTSYISSNENNENYIFIS